MYYIIITHSVYADNSIPDGAKVLYGLILSLSQKDGWCYAGNEYFSNTLNKEPRTIQLYLSKLKEKKYIHVDLKQNHVRRITTQDTRVNIKPVDKNPVETKKRALRNIQEPEWMDEFIDSLKDYS